MPINNSTFSPLAISTTQTIGSTLDNINSNFNSFVSAIRTTFKTLLAANPVIFGCNVTLDTFPIVNISSGYAISKLGVLYTFTSGVLTLPSTANEVYYIYISEDFVINFTQSVPSTAVVVLAKITNNGAGTAATLDLAMGIENVTSNAEGQPTLITLSSGPLTLGTTSYTYNVDQSISTITESMGSIVRLKEFSYNIDGSVLQIKTTNIPFGLFFYLGASAWDDSQDFDGVL